jgi:hypothetical protein
MVYKKKKRCNKMSDYYWFLLLRNPRCTENEGGIGTHMRIYPWKGQGEQADDVRPRRKAE